MIGFKRRLILHVPPSLKALYGTSRPCWGRPHLAFDILNTATNSFLLRFANPKINVTRKVRLKVLRKVLPKVRLKAKAKRTKMMSANP